MPYSLLTNVADYDAVLGHIRTFLNATGDWSLHKDLTAAVVGAGAGGRELVASNGDVLFGMRSTTTGAGGNRLYLFDGIPPYASGSTDVDNLNLNSGIRAPSGVITSAGEPSQRHLQQFAGPFPSLHLFTDDPSTYLHLALEVSAGIWKHLALGNLAHFGTWTGGGYYAAHYWALDNNNIDAPASTFHGVVFDNGGANISTERAWTVHFGAGASWLSPLVGPANGVTRVLGRASFRGGWGRMFKNIAESQFSGFIPLAPVVVAHVKTDDTPDTVRWIGQVPDMRMLNVQNIAPGDTLTIGSDEYLCFPLNTKREPDIRDNLYNSGYAGIAYRKRA